MVSFFQVGTSCSSLVEQTIIDTRKRIFASCRERIEPVLRLDFAKLWPSRLHFWRFFEKNWTTAIFLKKLDDTEIKHCWTTATQNPVVQIYSPACSSSRTGNQRWRLVDGKPCNIFLKRCCFVGTTCLQTFGIITLDHFLV